MESIFLQVRKYFKQVIKIWRKKNYSWQKKREENLINYLFCSLKKKLKLTKQLVVNNLIRGKNK